MESTIPSKEEIKITNGKKSNGRKRKPRRLNVNRTNRLVARIRRAGMTDAEKTKNKIKNQERMRRKNALLETLSAEQKEALLVANRAAAQERRRESVWTKSFSSVTNSGRRRRQRVLSGDLVRPDIREQEKLVRAWRAVRRGSDPEHPILLESSEEDLEKEGERRSVGEKSCLSSTVSVGAGSKYGVRYSVQKFVL